MEHSDISVPDHGHGESQSQSGSSSLHQLRAITSYIFNHFKKSAQCGRDSPLVPYSYNDLKSMDIDLIRYPPPYGVRPLSTEQSQLNVSRWLQACQELYKTRPEITKVFRPPLRPWIRRSQPPGYSSFTAHEWAGMLRTTAWSMTHMDRPLSGKEDVAMDHYADIMSRDNDKLGRWDQNQPNIACTCHMHLLGWLRRGMMRHFRPWFSGPWQGESFLVTQQPPSTRCIVTDPTEVVGASAANDYILQSEMICALGFASHFFAHECKRVSEGAEIPGEPQYTVILITCTQEKVRVVQARFTSAAEAANTSSGTPTSDSTSTSTNVPPISIQFTVARNVPHEDMVIDRPEDNQKAEETWRDILGWVLNGEDAVMTHNDSGLKVTKPRMQPSHGCDEKRDLSSGDHGSDTDTENGKNKDADHSSDSDSDTEKGENKNGDHGSDTDTENGENKDADHSSDSDTEKGGIPHTYHAEAG